MCENQFQLTEDPTLHGKLTNDGLTIKTASIKKKINKIGIVSTNRHANFCRSYFHVSISVNFHCQAIKRFTWPTRTAPIARSSATML
nr:hypothetical protein [Candidatus Sigynarchaeota archaeon]